MTPREMANVLRGVQAFVPGDSLDKVAATLGAVAAVAPRVAAILDAVDEMLSGDVVDERLVAAIARAEGRNRSREVEQQLRDHLAELEDVT